MHVSEPTYETCAHRPFLAYFLATRPMFLVPSVLSALLGLSLAFPGLPFSHLNCLKALLALFFSIMTSAGSYVFNDYYDFLNETDNRNVARIFPFTGGSRFIQNKVLTPQQTFLFASSLYIAAAISEIALAYCSSWQIIFPCLTGLFIGWAYSAPPLKLNCRGLGELFLFISFLLVTVSADFVIRGNWSLLPLMLGTPFALLVTNLLYINEFPDRKADLEVGKRHLVARLPLHYAPWGYAIIASVAYIWIGVIVFMGYFSPAILLSLIGIPFSLSAFLRLKKNVVSVENLTPAIQKTIVAMTIHGVLMTITVALL